MSGYVKFERPFLIRSAAGLAYYESAAFVQGIEDVYNSTAATAITRGMICVISATAAHLDDGSNYGGRLPRWDYSTAGADVNFATTLRIPVNPSAADTSLQPAIGVAMENIPAGATGRVVTDGLVAVNTVGTTIKGNYVITSAAGVGSGGPSNALVVGRTVGNVVVAAGAGTGTTGSATQTFIRVAPQ